MSTTASVIAHVNTDPTEIHATQVHHPTGTVSINLSLYVAGSFLTVAGPAPVLRALLTAQLAVLDQADPQRGNRDHLEQPFTPPRPATVAPSAAGVGS
jgi:hypothetical protein